MQLSFTEAESKAALWKQAELQILKEMHRLDLEKDEKRCKERCEVIWKPLNNLEQICFRDVVSLDKTISNNLKNNKNKYAHQHRGSENLKPKNVYCEIPMEIYYDCCGHKHLDYGDQLDELWNHDTNFWSNLRWRISYQGQINPYAYEFTAHLEFIQWKPRKKLWY